MLRERERERATQHNRRTINKVCIVYVNWTRRTDLRRAVIYVVVESDGSKYEKTKLLHCVGNEK